MLNTYARKPLAPLESRGHFYAEEDEVAASIRQRFRENISRILDDLRGRGVTQKAIAEALGKDPSAVTQLKSGKWFPSADETDRLLEVLNRFSDKPVDYEDLFRNPDKQADATRSLIEELAKRAGYKLIPDGK